MRRQRGEFGLRLQPVRLVVVVRGAVETERAGNMAIGGGIGRLFLAEEERGRPRVDQGRAAFAFDGLDIGAARDQTLVEGRGKNRRRRPGFALLDRKAGRLPGGDAAIEDRDVLQADDLERPVGARGGTEMLPAGTTTTCLSSSMPISPISFSSSATVGSMNGTSLRVTRQPALS